MHGARNLVRVGRVSTVDPERCTVRVVFNDIDGLVSSELPLLLHAGHYVLPTIGESVLCLFLSNGVSEGLCLGSFYSDEDTVPSNQSSRKGVWFPDGSHVFYDDLTGILHIKAIGHARIEGNLEVTGTITHGGLIP